MRNDILETLAKKKIFTFKDAKRISSVNNDVLKIILFRLERNGWIERIEKGKYLVIPLGSKKKEYTINEFVIGSVLVDPSVISYWSSLNYHGLTDQIPKTVFIQTTSRKKNQNIEIFGIRYRIIRISAKKMFGLEKIWFGDEQLIFTDKEKTIIDCLDKLHYSGGIFTIAEAIKNNDLDRKKIIEYAQRIGNSGVIRRLGYIYDFFDIPIDLPTVHTRNYLYLDPTMPNKKICDRKWKLYTNANLGEVE